MRYTVTPKATEDKNNDGVIDRIDDALHLKMILDSLKD